MAFLFSSEDGAELHGDGDNDVIGGDGNGMLLDGGAGNDTIFSFGNNNTLEGGDGNDELNSEAGSDVLNGGAGNDSLNAGEGDDTLNGGDGDDQLFAGFGADVANGDAGNDTISGGAGSDTLNGGDGNDTIYGDDSGPEQGTDGADVIAGGAGNDTLTGGGGGDAFKFSFNLATAPGQGETLTFTQWLSDKYGKDFGDELPDFEGGHHHHHHGKHHHHDKHDHHGKDHHHHGKHDHHHHHHGHHHKHGGCDDHHHHAHQWGLSEKFFQKNYAEWLRDVVVADLVAQGLAHDENGNGKIDVKLNAKDPDGTPRIEGLSDTELANIFGNRDEVTLRHNFHEHDRWYSNTYEPQSSDGETTVSSEDGFDTILDFAKGVDHLQFDGLDGLTTQQFLDLFELERGDTFTTVKIAGDLSWGVTLEGVIFEDTTPDQDAFAELFGVGTLDSLFS